MLLTRQLTGPSAGNVTAVPMNEREARLVAPFYLKMMRFNATWVGHEVWDEAVQVGRRATEEDVTWLLTRREWRPNVMGAWFSLARPAPQVVSLVLDSLSHSLGDLTSPPLAVSAAILAGRAAEPILRSASVRSVEESRRIVDAALAWLGLAPEADVTPESATAFSDLANFGLRLRTAMTS